MITKIANLFAAAIVRNSNQFQVTITIPRVLWSWIEETAKGYHEQQAMEASTKATEVLAGVLAAGDAPPTDRKEG